MTNMGNDHHGDTENTEVARIGSRGSGTDTGQSTFCKFLMGKYAN